ncbi:hypothetical protein B4U79_17782 [Dinothrombium tinctorium]|uniref:Peptidase S1 domain-containing protein n=1 Tax=Dinothrombium tinctorium TaxID=1965070 RepID=A0A3S5WGV7_9ACAR|nr:hypothetical protein B4U79_16516 [Dinothrombium tinctorium]RWS07883.1 hypothetical protein B4U79_16103 [Dinothrombium tinctorium]RWS07887.1 hypothetical protein B4U79_16100 [Dinothrombium tinctorium]RWS08341.1 hypothetical protein B4U79_17782 [Dinothrombium tinctorium]
MRPICLPEISTIVHEDMQLTTVGWQFGYSAPVLKQGLNSVVNYFKCKKYYKWVKNSLGCGRESDSKNEYLGNNGASLMHKFNHRWYLLGIVVFVDSSSEFPIVFLDTRLALYWLEKIRKDYSK